MLRITTEEKDQFTSFRLEGKLTGDWVRELERCWIRAKNVTPGRQFRVDLSEVGFVDDMGKALLEHLVAEGAELQADTPLMRSIIAGVVEHSNTEHANR